MNISDLTDEQLNELDEACTAEGLRRERLVGYQFAADLAALSDAEFTVFSDTVADLAMERAEAEMNAEADKLLAEESLAKLGRIKVGGIDNDAARRFQCRCAHLFKMAQLSAPEPLIINAVEGVLKLAPVSEHYEYKG